VSRSKCFAKAILADSTYAPAWTNLGLTVSPGASIVIPEVHATRTWTQAQLFEMAVSVDPRYAPAWANLGLHLTAGVTANINGQPVTKTRLLCSGP
jgi:hypothetical protein